MCEILEHPNPHHQFKSCGDIAWGNRLFQSISVLANQPTISIVVELHPAINRATLSNVYNIVPKQNCRLLPNFRRPPEFGRFQEIAQKIAQNFCAIFKIGQKRPKKLPNDTKTLKKLPK